MGTERKARAQYHRFTSEETAFLKSGTNGRSNPEARGLFNERFGLTLGPRQISRKMQRLGLSKVRHRYTPEEKRFIENNIAGRCHAEVAQMFNQKFNCSITARHLANFLHKHNLRNGRNHGKSNECHLKYKHMPIGSETMHEYIYVKTARPNVWKMKHLVIWEAAHGPVPEGHRVIFADRDKTNFALENLILVTKGELAVMNRFGLIFPDKELTKTGKAVAELQLLTGRRKREAKKGRKPGTAQGTGRAAGAPLKGPGGPD